MNPATIMLRWYRQSVGQAEPPHPQYTAEEVLQLLRPQPVSESAPQTEGTRPAPARAARTEAVRQAASRPAAWLGQVTQQHRQEIGELADRLPSLVFHHSIGGDLHGLLARYGGWSTWRYERALEVAGACIAHHLNGSD